MQALAVLKVGLQQWRTWSLTVGTLFGAFGQVVRVGPEGSSQQASNRCRQRLAWVRNDKSIFIEV